LDEQESLLAFEHYNCIPDYLVIGKKGMAGGLPARALWPSQR